MNGPLRPATGPNDYDGLGRERYWDMSDEQRTTALAQIVADSNAGVLQAPTKEFARGWLSEHWRHRQSLATPEISTFIRERLPPQIAAQIQAVDWSPGSISRLVFDLGVEWERARATAIKKEFDTLWSMLR